MKVLRYFINMPAWKFYGGGIILAIALDTLIPYCALC